MIEFYSLRCVHSLIVGVGFTPPLWSFATIVDSKNKWTLSPLGFDPDLSGSVGAVSNRTE